MGPKQAGTQEVKRQTGNSTAAIAHLPASGVIRRGELYRLRAFIREMGWGEHALRQARVAGLKMISFGREKYVLGDHALDFFERLATQPGRDANAREGA
jgi:hypothetical protein